MGAFDPYDCLVPIFLDRALPRRLQQIGTAVFTILPQFGYFLFTAAHITDDLKSGDLLVPVEGGRLEPIEGYVAFIDLPPEVKRASDGVDIAYYKLSSDFSQRLAHKFTPVSSPHSELIPSALELRVCSVAGYPASKSSKNGKKLTSQIYSVSGMTADAATYEALSISPESSIVIRYNKKTAVLPDGGRPATPSLRGVSGGGIFAWPVNWPTPESVAIPEWSTRQLVGIVHTYKEREGLIIGSTLLPVLAAVGLGEMKGFGGVE